jgi:hypothetical protein
MMMIKVHKELFLPWLQPAAAAVACFVFQYLFVLC